jgi:hypothetical protein
MSPFTNIAVDMRNSKWFGWQCGIFPLIRSARVGTGLEVANTRHRVGSDAAGWIDDRVNVPQALVDQIMANGIGARPVNDRLWRVVARILPNSLCPSILNLPGWPLLISVVCLDQSDRSAFNRVYLGFPYPCDDNNSSIGCPLIVMLTRSTVRYCNAVCSNWARTRGASHVPLSTS